MAVDVWASSFCRMISRVCRIALVAANAVTIATISRPALIRVETLSAVHQAALNAFASISSDFIIFPLMFRRNEVVHLSDGLVVRFWRIAYFQRFTLLFGD